MSPGYKQTFGINEPPFAPNRLIIELSELLLSYRNI